MNNLKIKQMPQLEVTTPLLLMAVKQYLDRIDFVNQINASLQWDHSRCKLSPGLLALAVVLTTFITVRFPLYKIDILFQELDVELLFGKGVKWEDFSDDAIGRTLDKIYEAGSSSLFFQLAMQAYLIFDIPLEGSFHIDTSSIALFGQYEGCTEEDYSGIDIAYGYSKDHRPDLKQVMVGDIVNPHGIPLYHKSLDGNTADCKFNNEMIVILSKLLGEKIRDFTYIADSKLININNLELLNPKDHVIPFISRCPDNFYKKIASKVKHQAYHDDNWADIGTLRDDTQHAHYWAQSYTKQITSKTGLNAQFRLVVFKSSSGQSKLVRRLEKEKTELSASIHQLKSKVFSCEPDAQKFAQAFRDEYRHSLFDVSIQIQSVTIEKKKRGKPGKIPATPEKVTTYIVDAVITGENIERTETYKQQHECFVLITNVLHISQADILWQYKGQQAVEIQFRLLKQPALAANIWLKKPERIEALVMLLHVSLLIRALMQYQVRERVKKMPVAPRIDFDNRRLERATSEKIISLLHGYNITSRKGQYYYSYGGKPFESLIILLDLLGIDPDQLIN